MKITILSPDLSHNCLGRAYLLAKILQRNYEVEIIGPIFGKGIWEPVVADKSIKYNFIEITGKFNPYRQLLLLSKKINGDVVYASKPLFSSYGVGLLNVCSTKKPLILDIDDWQYGFMKDIYSNLSFRNNIKWLCRTAVFNYGVGSFWNNFIFEKLAPLATVTTVSGRFLKNKFGGIIIWHARDATMFNPEKFNKRILREKYGIGMQKKVVLFLGSPRHHKGIEDLLESMTLIKDPSMLLMLVGLDDYSYSKSLRKYGQTKLKNRFMCFGIQPFNNIPEFLALADLIVIPQRNNFATLGQVPAKVFDAMALAKPIIATNVSDLPEILEGCGYIVDPEDPEKLAEMIRAVLDNRQEAEETGWRARQKLIANYSYDAMESILSNLINKLK